VAAAVVAALCLAVFVPILTGRTPHLGTSRLAARIFGRAPEPEELRMDGYSENERYGPRPVLV